MNIWTYWEGPAWPHIKTCFDTARMVLGDDWKLVTPRNLQQFLPNIDDLIHPNWRQVPEIGPKVCAIRSALIYRYGGMWADADTIWLQHPRILPDCRSFGIDFLYSTWPNGKRRVQSGYFVAPPRSDVVKQWIDGNNYTLEHEFSLDRDWWLVLGEHTLTPAVDAAPVGTAVQVDYRTFLPLDVDSSSHALFEPGDWKELTIPESVCFGLSNSWMMAHHWDKLLVCPRCVSRSPLLFHQLLHDTYNKIRAWKTRQT